MFKLKKGHQSGVYVPLRALFLVSQANEPVLSKHLPYVANGHSILSQICH